MSETATRGRSYPLKYSLPDAPCWVEAVGFSWCHHEGGITARQYRLPEDQFFYRHWNNVADFCASTRTDLTTVRAHA